MSKTATRPPLLVYEPHNAQISLVCPSRSGHGHSTSRDLNKSKTSDVSELQAPADAGSEGQQSPLLLDAKTDAASYIYPTLTHNEKERVAHLWRLTELVLDSRALEANLQTILRLLQKSTGWPQGHIGLLDVDVLVDFVTVGREKHTYPRRETICSHTATKEPKTILAVTNIPDDPVWHNAPQAKGGMKSYVGTQLCYTDQDGHTSILGTLCLTSNEDRPPLTAAQEEMLKDFAILVVQTIEAHSLLADQTSSGQMQALLVELSVLLELQFHSTASISAYAEMAETALSTVFPDCICSYTRHLNNGYLPLKGRSDEGIPVSDLQDGQFWEDTEFIDDYFMDKNHLPASSISQSGRTIKAVVYQLPTPPNRRSGPNEKQPYLVVESASIKKIFTDVDALFLRSIGLTISSSNRQEEGPDRSDGIERLSLSHRQPSKVAEQPLSSPEIDKVPPILRSILKKSKSQAEVNGDELVGT